MKKPAETFLKIGTPYSAIRATIKPLDLILFKSSGKISSVISWFEKKVAPNHCGDWSHVGIVIDASMCSFIDKRNPTTYKDDLYILESTLSTMKVGDVQNIEGRGMLGVQIRNLRDVISAYDKPTDSLIAWASLSVELTPAVGETTRAIVDAFLDKYLGAKYELICCLSKAVLPFPLPFIHTDKRLFCSELVVRLYQDLGVVDKKIDPETVNPSDVLGLGAHEAVKNIVSG